MAGMRHWLGAISAVAIAGAAGVAWADEEAGPLVRYQAGEGGMRLELPLSIAARAEQASQYAIDRQGTRFDGQGALSPQVRVGAKLDTGHTFGDLVFQAEYEHDVATGVARQGTDPAGTALPDSGEVTTALRKAYGRVSYRRFLNLGGGMMTSHWGLGLLANDGAHGWTSGSARFADPRGGDRQLRGFLALGLSESLGLVTFFAVDRAYEDDQLLPGDKATQIVGAVQLGRGKAHSGGVYVVRRNQDASDGHGFRATVVDLTGASQLDLGWARADLAFEAALVLGDTTFAPTVERGRHDLRQFGAAARAGLEGRRVGGVIDFLGASGDANLYDGRQTAFRADVNYDMGLLLYRRVLAAQSGRAPVTASDPTLVGRPTEDLDRLATRGGASNTIAVFPRAVVRPVDGLEVYGGPLLSWSAGGAADPLGTTVAGGSPRNALGGTPGSYLGTELDLGVRYGTRLGGVGVEAGLEGGLLLPGSALTDQAGQAMDRVYGGRALVRCQL